MIKLRTAEWNYYVDLIFTIPAHCIQDAWPLCFITTCFHINLCFGSVFFSFFVWKLLCFVKSVHGIKDAIYISIDVCVDYWISISYCMFTLTYSRYNENMWWVSYSHSKLIPNAHSVLCSKHLNIGINYWTPTSYPLSNDFWWYFLVC